MTSLARTRSLAIIRAALATVPMHASPAYCEDLLRPLCPFPKRNPGRAYKAWRRAPRGVLRERRDWAHWLGPPPPMMTMPLFSQPGVSRGTSSCETELST